jgi:hypothetical protein
MSTTYCVTPNQVTMQPIGKIVLPKDLIVPTIRWYHQVTGHPESKRLYQHIHQQYYNRDLRRLVDNFKCNYFQRNKLDGKGYGFLPECEVRLIPFEECATDLIGPWTIQVQENPYEIEVLSVIGTVTNLVKLIRINDKRSKTIARIFAQCWLTCYPWPQHCIHDPGTEFTGPEFQMLLQNCHIRGVCTTAKKQQSNAVCERMIHNRKYPKDILPNSRGHVAKYMGTYCQIYGDTLPTQNICATYMGTDC